MTTETPCHLTSIGSELSRFLLTDKAILDQNLFQESARL